MTIITAAPECRISAIDKEGRVKELRAPFPFYGGKSKVASLVWERFGNPAVYSEPFAGSAAVHLARPSYAEAQEVICDSDCGVANFWRACRYADPEELARWCDWPTFHHDLTARHKWLISWFAEHRHRLQDDHEFYDVQVAGWWAWGKSLWIGGNWCGGSAVDSIPRVGSGGQGVSAQRRTFPPGVVQAVAYTDSRGLPAVRPLTRSEILVNWMRMLHERFKRVTVLNGDWTSALTPSALQHPNDPEPSVAVFLDPPYRTTGRRDSILYESDADGTSDDVATSAYEWAVENGDRYRIAYCCHEDDFPVPPGWDTHVSVLSGVRDAKRRATNRDMVMFSPACQPRAQPSLFP